MMRAMKVRPDLPKLPPRFAALPVDGRGYPVPWFVAWIEGKPDFRVVRRGGIALAHIKRLCWLCGKPRGKIGAFVIGPMCAVNRVSSELPSHPSCAKFAAIACPFLTRPMAKRNERDIPDETSPAAGVTISRNPGVALVWATDSYEPLSDGRGGFVFQIGPPTSVHWYAEGREATREEVLRAVESGLPILRSMAEEESPDAVAELERMAADAMALLPLASVASSDLPRSPMVSP